jgi:hypothetical protein
MAPAVAAIFSVGDHSRVSRGPALLLAGCFDILGAGIVIAILAATVVARFSSPQAMVQLGSQTFVGGEGLLNARQERNTMPGFLSLCENCAAIISIALLPRTVPLPAIAVSDSLRWETVQMPGIRIDFSDIDRPVLPLVRRDIEQSYREIERFFARSFPRAFNVRIFPDRSSLSAYWRAAWQAPDFQPECWMVASGTGSMLSLLSPQVWTSQACEHDTRDAVASYQIILHELVHVFHGQYNPHAELDSLDDIGWFVEGVATYASGQLERAHARRVEEAVAKGVLPHALKDIWTGPYRYGLSGSLVRFIDITYGRGKIVAMLGCTSEKDLLGLLETTEDELLSRWTKTLQAGASLGPR